ncbi:hypothetical protein LK429_00785 [Hoylesella buccalis]|uniref:hypothetical protein n=1 Tax=Hoylesella buccalis TaxID=28127 RepID=UPI001D0840DD|nr:hypothetical protein [Hoylesella buccalis]MCB6900737.1 hypothetical protein [Hoylesella buccalis]UEA63160.1 hypothetical protein LK429_00785 [Hoylesella buccalis]UWP49549.1 hypothetical protein NQ518_00325 [Hoylesella buccalis ATCC 35310]
MKTFTFRWLICLSLLFFVTPCLYAQRFMLSDMFRGWGKDAKEGVLKKYTSEEQNGHQWILETDGKNGDNMNKKSMLHIGTSSWAVTKTVLTSCNEFDNVDTILVCTDSNAPYTVSLSIDNKPVESKKVAKNADICVLGFSAKGASGKVEVLMKYDESLKQAMSIYYIEVISRLSDIVALSSQHIKSGETYSYQVQRIFSKDYWNTICLPFDVEESQVQELFGNTHRLRTFTGNVDANGTMIFTEAKEIKAGVPYLLKPTKTVECPIFTNVIYTNAEPTVVSDPTGAFSFVGVFNPTELQTDGTELFLGNGDKLYKPSSSHNRMNGMRAFFRINKNSNTLSNGKYAIRFDDETTAIMYILPELKSHKPRTYNLRGMVVDDSQPLPPGIYVKNGKKICVSK